MAGRASTAVVVAGRSAEHLLLCAGVFLRATGSFAAIVAAGEHAEADTAIIPNFDRDQQCGRDPRYRATQKAVQANDASKTPTP